MDARTRVHGGVKATVATGPSETFASRHPLLVFGLLPLPVTLVVLAATALVFGLPVAFAPDVPAGRPPLPAVGALASMFVWAVRVIPFAAVAVLFTRAFVRSRAVGWWLLAAAVQVVLAAALFDCQVGFNAEAGLSTMCMGFVWSGTGRLALLETPWIHLLQTAVPVAIGMLIVNAARERRTVCPGVS